MGMNLLGLSPDATRLRRIAAILRDGMGEGAAPIPAAIWALCVLVLALHFLVPAVHRPART